MEEQKLPPLFDGATHRRVEGGEPVKAVQWNKDGDHPKVERYPIERRHWKGLLKVGPKHKLFLLFHDWILEDAKGRLWVMRPTEFGRQYAPIAMSLLVLVALIGLLSLLFGSGGDLPILYAVTHLMYYNAIEGQWDGTTNGVFDLDTDTMKTSAHTNTYTPNQDTHDFFDDLTNEVTGTNYTAGGATIGTTSVGRSSGTVTFDGADVVWTQSASGFSTARKFVVYRSTGAAATSRLFSVVTADGDVGNVTGDLTIAWSASGIATWSTT